MAKSSRSKWKKLHRRQRAKAESKNTIKRVSKLHKKLELTAKGGISLIPPQEPETRFHFTNPEKNLRVPDPRREYNNDYRQNKVVLDFSKPLQLPPPQSNFYGKSDLNAPHPMTIHYETIDADAPIAGHAMTKADVERAMRKSQEATAASAVILNEDNLSLSSATMTTLNVEENEEDADDGPEEYTFGMEDTAPRRVQKKHKLSSKKSQAISLQNYSSTPKLVIKEKGVADQHVSVQTAAKKDKNKIRSMMETNKVNNVVVSTGGTSKVKKMSGMSGSSASRISSSGGTTSNAKKKKK